MEKFFEKTINSKMIYQGKILNLRKDKVQLPDGNNSQREVIEHSGGVTILPITEEGRIVMVKQFRKPAGKVLMELPAGKLEKNETPKDCAWRELREETSFRAKKLEKICSFYTTPGYSSEKLYLYKASKLSFDESAEPEEGEFIERFYLEPEKILEYIRSDLIQDGKTLIGLLYFLGVSKNE
ncbi:MAG: NUDIX hydrolase [Halanaerobiales bacterium]